MSDTHATQTPQPQHQQQEIRSTHRTAPLHTIKEVVTHRLQVCRFAGAFSESLLLCTAAGLALSRCFLLRLLPESLQRQLLSVCCGANDEFNLCEGKAARYGHDDT